MKKLLISILCISISANILWGQAANPSLTPPGAPSGNVFKTLDQIEPATPINTTNTPGNVSATVNITKSGVYYLTGDITGESGKHGILVTANDVTIDLNGFKLIGVSGSNTGIATTPNTTHRITIKNGVVIGWGLDGINVRTGFISNISVIDNKGNGIYVQGGGKVENCHAQGNGTSTSSYGIAAFEATVVNSSASSNKGTGILVADATMESCTSKNNAKYGLHITRGLMKCCQTSANESDGIFAQEYSTVIQCISSNNGANDGDGAGIFVSSSEKSVRIEKNTTYSNDRGIDVDGTGNVIVGNISTKNQNSSATDLDYDIVANNIVGPIVKLGATTSAVTGNTGGTGTIDPNTNFSD